MTGLHVATTPLIPSTTADARSTDEERIAKCTAMVERWLAEADTFGQKMSGKARRRARRIGTVVKDRSTAELMMSLTDEVLRIDNTKAAALRFAQVVKSHSTALPFVDRTLLAAGARFAPRFHRIIMPLVVSRLRRETSATIISADRQGLDRHQELRRAKGFVLNVNRLGEAILGHGEARTRRDAVVEMMNRPTTTHVSIKLSAIAANISALDYRKTIERLAGELRPVYEAAAAEGVFVNLDMEEYRDLAITVAVFKQVLDEPAFHTLTAGIVLQAYLPDSHAAAEELGNWAVERMNAGRAPIRIRLVKGANLGMEMVDAELHGWATATYPSKLEVDASWKRLLDSLLDARFDGALTVGAGSHNLFDVAWALLKRDELVARGFAERLRFEMLEGMAEAQAQAVLATAGDLLMYTPVVDRVDFIPAIGYLTRRLDENTGPENFLRALIDLTPGTPTFDDQVRRFSGAVRYRHALSTKSRRAHRPVPDESTQMVFANASDSDVTQTTQRHGLIEAVRNYEPSSVIPVETTTDAVDRVVASARAGASTWGATSHEERALLLRSVAARIEAHRYEIVALMAHEANKVILEGDAEVSEAIDFANYYAVLATELETYPTMSEPLGVVAVTPPWNFPYAITMGGVLAALAAGNVVILKPTPQCPRVAARVAADCWAAGIPTYALHLLAVPDDHIGRHLITHDGIDAVILTGSIDTARMFLGWKPDLRLLAETSGKNSLVVTATADLDLAIKDLVRSAFGHAGQKCSAASLAIVEAPVYDDPDFRRRLADAVATLTCGPATDPGTDVPPLIEAPGGSLRRAFTQLEPGESWLVEPRNYDPSDDRCWTPGVRFGVSAGSWFHQNECFGPVLGVMRANDLHHAIEMQNATRYGLTAGLHSLNDDEVALWAERVEAGNVYVNRTITGAIVQRQPFGGWKSSAVGPACKAGGPSYVNVLRRWAPGSDPKSLEALASLAGREADPSALRCETNTLRYRPLPGGVTVWSDNSTHEIQLELARLAATATGTVATFLTEREHPDHTVIDHLATHRPDRLRLLGHASTAVRSAAHELGIRIDDDPMTDEARLEVVRWMREQSLTVTQHRHGRPRPMAV